jgi:tetratricopeptide (TPR) repeat protein
MILQTANIDLSSWDGVLAFLHAELEAASSEERRALLLESIAFVESEGLSDKDAALSSLRLALADDPNRSRSLWDSWRFADRLTTSEQELILSALAALPEPKEDGEQRFLRWARFLGNALGREERAASAMAVARGQWPEGFHSLLAEAEACLFGGRQGDAAKALEALSSSIQDSRVRAALRMEAAWLRRDSGADDDIARLLEEVLSEPLDDGMLVRQTLDLAAEIGDWVLYENALCKLAAIASNKSEGGAEFDGIDRGAGAGAAYWWQVAMVRERRLGKTETAAEALDKALELRPGHPLLCSERARLLEALGRFDEAFEALPEGASVARRAELLLLSGRRSEAADLLNGSSDKGIVSGVLRDLLGVPVLSPSGDPDEDEAFLHAHPAHEQAASVAARLLEHREDTAASFVVAEKSVESAPWPPLDSISEILPWGIASRVMARLMHRSEEDTQSEVLDWAEASADPMLKAALTSVSAQMAEDSGELEHAFELYERAQSLFPQTLAARLVTPQIMLRLEKYSDLVERLRELSSQSSVSAHRKSMLHQVGHLLRSRLGDSVGAAEVFEDLCEESGHTDLSALWSAFEVAFESQNMPRAVEVLGRLAEQCPEDSDWLRILAAEIDLLLIGDYEDALVHLERAGESYDETIARSARLYRMLALYLRGDITSIDEALQAEALMSQGESARMWIPELLETGRGARGAQAMSELLEADGDVNPVKLLWLLLVGAMSGEPGKVVAGLRSLGQGAPPGEIAGACRAASLLLDSTLDLVHDGVFADADVESSEVLMYVADRMTRAVPSERRLEIALGRAELCRDYDLSEWADWRLEAAEACAELGQNLQGLAIVRESLEEQPEHPGLLEAYSLLASEAQEHQAMLDAHRRLAAFYDEPTEKAHQLCLAAGVASLKLGLAEDGLSLAQEAVEVDPASDEAHAALVAMTRLAGDDSGLRAALEAHLTSATSSQEQVRLLWELAEHQMKTDDPEGCLATLDRLLELDPSRADALLMKIDILSGAGLLVEQLETMDAYIRSEAEMGEARKMAWRAAELAAQRLSDLPGAIERLRLIEARGDEHPDTQRRLVFLLAQEQRWEEAADALHRLAGFVSERDKRLDTLYEEARVRLEQLFDDNGASRVLDEILDESALHLGALELADSFRPRERNQLALERALSDCFSSLSVNPIDLLRIGKLGEVARLAGQWDVRAVCDETLAFLSIAQPASFLEEIPEPAVGKSAELQVYLRSSETVHPASLVAEIAAEAAADAFADIPRALQIGRGTRLAKRGISPLRDWLERWAKVLGYEELEVHAAGDSPQGSLCLPGAVPTVAICADATREPSSRDRYFALLHLFRSAQGLGAFSAVEHAGPQRWVLAVAAAVLGDPLDLPIPTDSELVQRARKALSRKARARLEGPSVQLVQQTAASLRAWSADCVAMADRCAFLGAAHLLDSMQGLVVQEAGIAGAQTLLEDPVRQLPRLPRARDLLCFALGGQLFRARQIVAGGNFGNGGKP